MALYSITVVGIGPFGSLAAGAMAHHYGARLTVISGGVLYLIAAAVFRAHLPIVRVPAEVH
jgi:fucose permease